MGQGENEFYAYDFSYVDNLNPPYIGHFKHTDPASVKAYYAPHGTDTWTELTVSENMGTGMYIVTAQTDNGTVSAKVAL